MRSIIEILNPRDVSKFLLSYNQLPNDLRSNYMLNTAVTFVKDRMLFRAVTSKDCIELGTILLVDGVIVVALSSFNEKLEYEEDICAVVLNSRDYKVINTAFTSIDIPEDDNFIYVKVANSGEIAILKEKDITNCFFASNKVDTESIVSCILTDTQLDRIVDKDKAYSIIKYLSTNISKDFQLFAKIGVVTGGATVTVVNVDNWIRKTTVALTVVYTFEEDGIGYVVVKDGQLNYGIYNTTDLTGYR